MNKLLPSLAVALLLGTGIAAPVMAESDGDHVVGTEASTYSFDADAALQRLQSNGVKALDVAEDWNDTVRATVKLDDGSVTFQYFDKDTLRPAVNSRVLSKLDVAK